MPPEDNPADEVQTFACETFGCEGSIRLVKVDGGHTGEKWECDTCGYYCRDSGIDE